MGCYAEVIRASFAGAVVEPDLPRDRGWVVLTVSSHTPAEVRRIFPSARRLVLLTAGDEQHPVVPDVNTARFTVGPPPALSTEAREALADDFGSVVLLDGIENTSGRLLADLRRLRISHVAWRRGVGWHVTSIKWAILRKPLARLERYLEATRLVTWYRKRAARAQAHCDLRERNSQAWFGQREWFAHLERLGLRAKRPRPEVMKVMLYIGQLNSGGAERQLVNLALGLRRQGHSVRALTTYPLSDENAHYCDDLRNGGVVHFCAGSELRDGVCEALQQLDISSE
ncbi:MAG TPA: hypothetical protein EYO97_06035, partial [Gemmatimonadetes bacterium]|nr:hypothetical protein [Gemmatimonadota bacterium]